MGDMMKMNIRWWVVCRRVCVGDTKYWLSCGLSEDAFECVDYALCDFRAKRGSLKLEGEECLDVWCLVDTNIYVESSVAPDGFRYDFVVFETCTCGDKSHLKFIGRSHDGYFCYITCFLFAINYARRRYGEQLDVVKEDVSIFIFVRRETAEDRLKDEFDVSEEEEEDYEMYEYDAEEGGCVDIYGGVIGQGTLVRIYIYRCIKQSRQYGG